MREVLCRLLALLTLLCPRQSNFRQKGRFSELVARFLQSQDQLFCMEYFQAGCLAFFIGLAGTVDGGKIRILDAGIGMDYAS